MSSSDHTRLAPPSLAGTSLTPAVSGAPQVRLLDARHDRIADEQGLQAAAGAMAERVRRSGAAHVSCADRFPYAVVAWHSGPVGVELERVAAPEEDDPFATSLRCGKEALGRALGDPVAYDPARLGAPIYWRDGEAGPWRAAQLEVPSGHNGWLCWRTG